MKINIPIALFVRSGKSEDNINNTLEWILGYIAKKYKPKEIFSLISIDMKDITTVTIENSLIEQIKIKFDSDNYDKTISILLVFAYSMGGME